MKFLKKTLCLLAVALLITGLAACNSNENSSSTGNITTSTSKSKTAPEITSPEVTEPVENYNPEWTDFKFSGDTITVCIDWAPTSAWVQSWEKAFHHYFPNVKVEYKKATPGEKAARLSVWKNAGQSPDVIYIKPEESWPTLMNKQLVSPVDSYIDFNKDFWKTTKGIAEGLKIDGKNHVIITSAYRFGSIIYNPEIFKNAGLEDPLKLLYENKWTLDTFESYAKRLTKIDTQDDTKSRYGAYLRYAEPFLALGGKDLISYENGAWKSNLNDPLIVNQVEFLKRIGPAGEKSAIIGGYDETQLRSMTISGQLAMYVTAESPGMEFPEEFKTGKLRAVPFPKLKSEGEYFLPGVIDGFCIPEGAKNPDGGAAYAMAVRALTLLELDLDIEDLSTEEYKQMEKFIDSKATYVPMQFRRLQGKVEYYNVYGSPLHEGVPYSGIVQEWEPVIMAELAKESK